MLKKQLPNLITLLNLYSGCIAVLFALQSQFGLAALFVGLGVFFDFFDGLVARKLQVESPLGIQLDSLADMVTSGLVPGLVMYKLISFYNPESTILIQFLSNTENAEINILALFAFLIPLASAYRLAKFNIDAEQSTYFKGLPTPANALLILSIPLILKYNPDSVFASIFKDPTALIGLILLSSFLLISNLKLFALKLKKGDALKTIKLLFLITSIVLLFSLHFVAIPLIILLYFIISLLFTNKIN